MSTERSPRRLRRCKGGTGGSQGPCGVGRLVPVTAAVGVLALTASGCVTVHGEREVLSTATKSEAQRALSDFLSAYNKADQAFDPTLDADRVTGALGAINQAGLTAQKASSPTGNANYSPLKLTNAQFVIPKKAGWPRWFVADTDANRGNGTDRWLLVFTRATPDDVWAVSYLTVMAPEQVPAFKTDEDGNAEAVPADSTEVAVPPARLSQDYAAYLRQGGDEFAPGTHTSGWRDLRAASASRPGKSTQFIDQPLTSDAYAPLALRTADGGALVFFTTRHFEKQTAAQGLNLSVDANVRALMTGEAKRSITLERVSNQAVLDPVKTAADQQVKFLSRIQGLTGAKGE